MWKRILNLWRRREQPSEAAVRISDLVRAHSVDTTKFESVILETETDYYVRRAPGWKCRACARTFEGFAPDTNHECVRSNAQADRPEASK